MTFNNYDEYYSFLSANPNFTGVCVFLLSNGKKRFEDNYVNGKQHGKQFGWHNNGKKWFEHNFVNGIQTGIQLYDGETYEEKLEDGLIWYLIVKETL